MSDLLNLSKILQENSTLNNLVVKSSVKESYLVSTLNTLSNINESFTGNTKTLYKNINEAESKSEENDVFCKYYEDYKKVLNKYISDLSSLASRFSITIDNIIDSAREYMEDQELLTSNICFKYNVIKYENLGKSKYPKFDVRGTYYHEFNCIGKMMQELGPIASNEAKMQIIATAYNDMSKCMKNKWMKKTIENITGCDDCKDLYKYSKCIKNIFKDDEYKEIMINKSKIFSVIKELELCTVYKDEAINIAMSLENDFKSIFDHVSSMCYRNKDNVLKIRSNKSGVLDKDYSLDTYGMNQLNIFMKSKINQINQLFALYLIALSTKMDTITEYASQCRNILSTAREQLTICRNSCKYHKEIQPCIGIDFGDADEDDEDDNENSDNKDNGIYDLDDDSELLDMMMDDGNIEPDTPVEDPEESEENNSKVIHGNSYRYIKERPNEYLGSVNNDNADIEESTKEFECLLYSLESMYEANEINSYIHESLLLEKDEDSVADDEENTEKNSSSVKDRKGLKSSVNLAGKTKEIWWKILDGLKKMWGKFVNVFINHTSKRIKFIENHKDKIAIIQADKEKYVPSEVNDEDGSSKKGFTVIDANLNTLKSVKIPDFIWNNLKDKLGNKDAFAKYVLGNISIEKDEDFVTSYKNAIIKPESEVDVKDGTILKEMVDYCLNYKTFYTSIEDDIKMLDKAKSMADKMANTITDNIVSSDKEEQKEKKDEEKKPKTESLMMDYYFNEATSPSGTNPNVEGEVNSDDKDDVKKAIMVYFNVCSRITSARMSCAQKIFNEYYYSIYNILKYNKMIKGSKEEVE